MVSLQNTESIETKETGVEMFNCIFVGEKHFFFFEIFVFCKTNHLKFCAIVFFCCSSLSLNLLKINLECREKNVQCWLDNSTLMKRESRCRPRFICLERHLTRQTFHLSLKQLILNLFTFRLFASLVSCNLFIINFFCAAEHFEWSKN